VAFQADLAALIGSALAALLVAKGVRSFAVACATAASAPAFVAFARLLGLAEEAASDEAIGSAFLRLRAESAAIERVDAFRARMGLGPAPPVAAPAAPLYAHPARIGRIAFQVARPRSSPRLRLHAPPRPEPTVEAVLLEAATWVGNHVPTAKKWVRVRGSFLRDGISPSVAQVAERFVSLFRPHLLAADTGFRRSAARGVGHATLRARFRGMLLFIRLLDEMEEPLPNAGDGSGELVVLCMCHRLAGASSSRFRSLRAGIEWGDRSFGFGLADVLSAPEVQSALRGIALAAPPVPRGKSDPVADEVVIRLQAICAGRVRAMDSLGFALVTGALIVPGLGGVRWQEGVRAFALKRVDGGAIIGVHRSKTAECTQVFAVSEVPLESASAGWLDRYLQAVEVVMGAKSFRVLPAPVDVRQIALLAQADWPRYFNAGDSASWRVATQLLRHFATIEVPGFPVPPARPPAPHGMRSWLTTLLSRQGYDDGAIARVLHWGSGGSAPASVRTYDRSVVEFELRTKRRAFMKYQAGWRSNQPLPAGNDSPAESDAESSVVSDEASLSEAPSSADSDSSESDASSSLYSLSSSSDEESSDAAYDAEPGDSLVK